MLFTPELLRAETTCFLHLLQYKETHPDTYPTWCPATTEQDVLENFQTGNFAKEILTAHPVPTGELLSTKIKEFLDIDVLKEKAEHYHLSNVYTWLVNQCYDYIQSENEYYDKLADTYLMELTYSRLCEYGPCDDQHWQNT